MEQLIGSLAYMKNGEGRRMKVEGKSLSFAQAKSSKLYALSSKHRPKVVT